MTRIQLRGKAGQIVATDGRQLLVQGGFSFPWNDSILIPRVPAFGARELSDQVEVGVGRTKTHVAVKVGRWTFLLAIDTHARFPDADKPVVCRDERRTYLWMPLDKAAAIPPGPGPDTRRIDSAEGLPPPTEPHPVTTRSDDPMPARQVNRQPPDSGRPAGSTEPERWGIAEVIAETETLRALLHDAAVRSARLLAALKHQRRKSRAVRQAMQSLKDLQLDR